MSELGSSSGIDSYLGKAKVDEARLYAKYTRRTVDTFSGKRRKQAEVFLEAGDKSIDGAEASYREGDVISGDQLLAFGTQVLDLALSWNPLTSWPKDVWEACKGENAVTGEKLSTLERSFSIVGALSAGLFSKLGKLTVLAGIFNKGERAAEALKEAKAIAEGAKGASRKILTFRSQLQKKFKHAEVFGIHGNPNNELLSNFAQAIERHVAADSRVVIQGTYHQTQKVIHYVDRSTGICVMKDETGIFISGWKLNDDQLKNVLERGSL